MNGAYWYVDRDGNRRGPVALEEMAALVREGAVGRATLVWSSGMNDWRKAEDVEALAQALGAPPAGLGAGSVAGPLAADFPVWGLFWRWLVTALSAILIVPFAWVAAWFIRWLCARISLSDGTRLTFAGVGAGLWPIFMIWAIVLWAVGLWPHVAPRLGLAPRELLLTIEAPVVLLEFVAWALELKVFKWVCANVGAQDGRLKFEFDGGYWQFVGWCLLVMLSVFTVIGWAWVIKFMLRWICARLRGTAQFEFTGDGLGILWRTIVWALLAALIIPIPWILRWQARWYLSQVTVR